MDDTNSAEAAMAASASEGSCSAGTRQIERVRPRSDFRTGTPLLVAEMLVAWTMWRAGEGVNEIARQLGRRRTFTRDMLFGGSVQ